MKTAERSQMKFISRAQKARQGIFGTGTAQRVLQHLADLWTYDVSLVEVDASDKILKEYLINPRMQPAAA